MGITALIAELGTQVIDRQRAGPTVFKALRRGEILGIAGLMGSGRTELARSIFGADAFRAGPRPDGEVSGVHHVPHADSWVQFQQCVFPLVPQGGTMRSEYSCHCNRSHDAESKRISPLLSGLLASLLLTMVWLLWAYTTWVTNWLDPDRIAVRLLLLALAVISLISSAALPTAFARSGLIVGGAYLVMQAGRSAFAVAVIGDPALRRNFQRIRPASYRMVRGLEDGEEIGLDRTIESRVARKMGEMPDQRVYKARKKEARDVATLFLLDMSASTDEPIHREVRKAAATDDDDRNDDWMKAWQRRPQQSQRPRRIIDVNKEALVIMAEALEEMAARG